MIDAGRIQHVIQAVKPQGSKIQFLADLVHHTLILLRLGICILLQNLIRYVSILQPLNDTSRDQIHL